MIMPSVSATETKPSPRALVTQSSQVAERALKSPAMIAMMETLLAGPRDHHLKIISAKQHIVVSQLGTGLAVTRSQKFKYLLNSIRMRNSTALLASGSISVKEFLIQCCHSTDRYLERELNWQNNDTDDSEDDVETTGPDANDVVENLTYSEEDFIVPEDMVLEVWQEDFDNEIVVPFVRVPFVNDGQLSSNTEDTRCVVCGDNPRTHALIPCGHKVLCFDCVARLEHNRCPICNSVFDSFLRIW
ncbi:uncharacterized protein LOC126839788 [Adelges cooleyi]|uniref:uncharacterized protein LOC126839788 n=1 Tax=Adelges cooleyi TaxID=133065 RepID=UPI00217F3BED|nr:uncharacterized protein LOC126839788 [Adelges cooleyi]